jgi:hypothetical protein
MGILHPRSAPITRRSMTLKLKVDYKAPSREQLFLGAGWEPARDVRGAFISGPAGELLIGNWALSVYYASQLTLAFSMTNRAAVDAMMVRASGAFGSSHVIVQKSLQARLVISPLFADPSRSYVRIILEPAFGPSGTIPESPATMDLIALDELEMERVSR